MRTNEFHGQLVLLIFVSVVTIFRLITWNIADLNLAFDEAQYWTWSLDLDWGYYSKPPLLAWLINLFSNTCGMSEFCIRLISPILYAISTFFVSHTAYLVSEQKKRDKVAFIAGTIWLLIPGVSLSSGLISTDVPMLFFASIIIWGLTCYSFKKNIKYQNLYLVLIATCLAFGFLSKYSILFIPFSLSIYYLTNCYVYKESNRSVNIKIIILCSIFFVLIIFPHILWSLENGFITFQHTVANANFRGSTYSIYNAIKFFLEQFAVFGPINFLMLLYIYSKFKCFSKTERLFFFLSVVPIVIMLFQAFFSRSHANWAAIAYIPSTILIAIFIEKWSSKFRIYYYFSLGISFFVLVLLPILAYSNFKYDPFKKMRGWEETALQVSTIYSKYQDAILVTDDRKILAELIYYMKKKPNKWIRWNADGKIHDHYELVTKHEDLIGKTGIMVSVEPDNKHFIDSFKEVKYLDTVDRIVGKNEKRVYKVWLLREYMVD